MNAARPREVTGADRTGIAARGGTGRRSGTGDAAAVPDPPAELALEVGGPAPGVLLVAVVGELDTATAPAVERCVQDQVEARPDHLVVDLSRTTFLSARGVGLLVGTRQSAEDAGVGLHLVGAIGNRPVERVLHLTGVVGSFSLHGTVPGVLAVLG